MKLSKFSASSMIENLLREMSKRLGLIATEFAFALIFDYSYVVFILSNQCYIVSIVTAKSNKAPGNLEDFRGAL